jgi:hypothetical protein
VSHSWAAVSDRRSCVFKYIGAQRAPLQHSHPIFSHVQTFETYASPRRTVGPSVPVAPVPPIAIFFARREDFARHVGASGGRPRAERRSALQVWLRLRRAVSTHFWSRNTQRRYAGGEESSRHNKKMKAGRTCFLGPVAWCWFTVLWQETRARC